MNYCNLQDLSRDLLTWRLPSDIEVVVGIPRSGFLAATILSLHRNLPCTDVDGLLAGRVLRVGHTKNITCSPEQFLNTPRKVLVVDDSCLSGNAVRRARESLLANRVCHQLLFGVVYMNPGCERHVDFYRRLLPAPRLFEWNLPHSKLGAEACWDIDGVLCPDPTEEENDDGPKYLRFLFEAPAQIRPSVPLTWIVSSRLEKYRSQTEDWLARNGIVYNRLVMLDLPDMRARRASHCHATFKADVYKSTPASIFIESSRSQAFEIARLSGKYVICFDTQECIAPGAIGELKHQCSDYVKVVGQRFRSRMKRLYDACMESRNGIGRARTGTG